MKSLNHVIVKKDGKFIGKYAILLQDGWLTFKTVSGQDCPVALFIDCLQAVDIDILKKANALHKTRRYSWRVNYRQGRSGSCDFWVEYLIDKELKIIRKSKKLHISMFNKLNEGVSLWLGDLYPILWSDNFPDCSFKEHGGYEFKVIHGESIDINNFNNPGTDGEGNDDDIEIDEIE